MERTIEGQKRAPGSKPNALRREGKLPAVLYGHQGAESVQLVVDTKTAETLLKTTAVNKSVVHLNVPEMSWSGKTIIKEVQSHPAKGHLYHISFCATDEA